MRVVQMVGSRDQPGDQLVEAPARSRAETGRPDPLQLGWTQSRQDRHHGAPGRGAEVSGEPVYQLVAEVAELLRIEGGAE
jgi:hypothetical protein